MPKNGSGKCCPGSNFECLLIWFTDNLSLDTNTEVLSADSFDLEANRGGRQLKIIRETNTLTQVWVDANAEARMTKKARNPKLEQVAGRGANIVISSVPLLLPDPALHSAPIALPLPGRGKETRVGRHDETSA